MKMSKKTRRPDVHVAWPSVQKGIGTPYGAAVLQGTYAEGFISRMPEVLLEHPHIPCRMRIDNRGGRIGACCNVGISDNDTVIVILASAWTLSRGIAAFFSGLQIVA